MKETILNLLTHKKRFLTVTITLTVLAHLFFLDMPPRSHHVWRQCNTLAVARNFYEEDMNILRPRVDRRQDTDGVTGMQFPSYEYILALQYKVFGEYNIIHRLTSLLIFILGLWGMYNLTELLFNNRLYAAIATWTLCWSPLMFYHSINALPDVLALSASIWGLYGYVKWQRDKRVTNLLISLFGLTLAGLTKLQFLAVGFPIAIWVFQSIKKKEYSTKNYIQLGILGIVSVSIPVAWYIYANHLIDISGLHDFVISFRPVDNLADGLSIMKRNIIQDFPEFILNYAGFILLLLGLYALVKYKLYKHTLFPAITIWALGLIAYHIIELHQMQHHQYYMMVYLPMLVLMVAAGAGYLLKKNQTVILIILLIAQPFLAAVRVIPARWMNEDKAVPVEFQNAEMLKELQNAVPDDALIMAGPDASGCIYFYFLHKKGFGIEKPELLDEQPTYIANCTKKGAKYLYTNNTYIKQLVTDEGLGTEMKQVGEFTIFKLGK